MNASKSTVIHALEAKNNDFAISPLLAIFVIWPYTPTWRIQPVFLHYDDITIWRVAEISHFFEMRTVPISPKIRVDRNDDLQWQNDVHLRSPLWGF